MFSRLKRRQRTARLERQKKELKQRTAKRLLIESLEPRMVLAADFIFDATAEQRTGFQLTLTSDGRTLHVGSDAGFGIEKDCINASGCLAQ